ncbi:MAG TPA: DUF993 family protein, partial [Amaricoccus sp.]|nr:DUF993 family protein [Amaricoccus sp.]
MATLTLPAADRTLEAYTTRAAALPVPDGKGFNRVAFAAAHVVADPLADVDPWLAPAIDWEATIRFRHYLWDLGFGVAEAMDTAHHGIACGAGTDGLVPGAAALD